MPKIFLLLTTASPAHIVQPRKHSSAPLLFSEKVPRRENFFSTLEKLFSTLEKTFSRQEKNFSSVAVFLENNLGFPTPYVGPSPSGVWRRAAFIRFARHGHNLMGESPERAPIAGSA